jgi:hypothetical protein
VTQTQTHMKHKYTTEVAVGLTSGKAEYIIKHGKLHDCRHVIAHACTLLIAKEGTFAANEHVNRIWRKAAY